MPDAIAVLNAGSSTLKVSLFGAAGDAFERVAHEIFEIDASRSHEAALDAALERVERALGGRRLAAIGHRVVHGGTEHAAPVRVDERVLAALEALVPLAPLHQPHNLAPIRRLLAERPALPQVACFDTAFHRSIPEVEQLFAIPLAWADAGVRRYGFHGLSYESIAAQLPHCDPRAAAGRTIVLHLGSGVSLCALRAGCSVATTMGFSTLDGVPMGTRPGALDAGVLLHLLDRHDFDARRLERLLYHESGLLGVSGVSGDMRDLVASDAPRARLAIDLFVHRVAREIGSLAAALGGLDALVFTAGIGEHAPAIRARIARASAWLGVEIDAAANAAGGPRLDAPASRVAVWVLPTDEEREIARHTRELMRPRRP